MARGKQTGEHEWIAAAWQDMAMLGDGVETGCRVVIKQAPQRGRVYIIAELLSLDSGRVSAVQHRYVREYPDHQQESFANAVWYALIQLGKMVLEAGGK